MKCQNCGKDLVQIKGKRKKEYCNSTCRSNFWQKEQVKKKKPVKSEKSAKVPQENKKPVFVLEYCNKCCQITNHIGSSCQICKIPPPPIRKPNEDAIDYALRKNEWKLKYQ